MYRPPTDPSQYNTRPTQARTSCPSCGAPITPEQDTQIRNQDRERQESIIEKIRVAGLPLEERQQEGLKPKIDFGRFKEGQQSPEVQEIETYLRDSTKTGTLHSDEAGIRQRGIDLKAKYGDDLQGYLDKYNQGRQPGLPGQQKPFPTGDLWDRKRENENTTGEYLGYIDGKLQTFLSQQAAQNAGATGIQSNFQYQPRPVRPTMGLTPNFDDMTAGGYPIHGDENSWGLGSEETMKKKYPTGFPTNDLFQRKQQETGFYQGPSAAEQKKGTIWGAPKKSRLGQSQKLSNFGAMGNQGSSSQYQKLPNFGSVGNEGNAFTRDRRKSIQGVMGKMY